MALELQSARSSGGDSHAHLSIPCSERYSKIPPFGPLEGGSRNSERITSSSGNICLKEAWQSLPGRYGHVLRNALYCGLQRTEYFHQQCRNPAIHTVFTSEWDSKVHQSGSRCERKIGTTRIPPTQTTTIARMRSLRAKTCQAIVSKFFNKITGRQTAQSS